MNSFIGMIHFLSKANDDDCLLSTHTMEVAKQLGIICLFGELASNIAIDLFGNYDTTLGLPFLLYRKEDNFQFKITKEDNYRFNLEPKSKQFFAHALSQEAEDIYLPYSHDTEEWKELYLRLKSIQEITQNILNFPQTSKVSVIISDYYYLPESIPSRSIEISQFAEQLTDLIMGSQNYIVPDLFLEITRS